ncbi:MAG: response regulator [Magnetococcales bacterium]|nr:response regulator [Magnetococcales bacterium]
MQFSLRIRMVVLMLAMIVCVIGYLLFFFYPKQEQKGKHQLSVNATRQLSSVSEALVPYLIQDQIAAVHEVLDVLMEQNPTWKAIIFYDRDGNRLYPLFNKPIKKSLQLKELSHIINLRGEKLGILTLIVDFGLEMKELRQQNRELIVTLSLGILLLSILMWILVDHYVRNPLQKLVKASIGLSNGDYQVALPRATNDELGDLVKSFNKMRYDLHNNYIDLSNAKQQAEQANRAKSQFLAHISHEIRTPLNAILGMNSVLAESKLSKEQRRFLQTSQNSGQTLLALINDVLDLSKIEAGQIDLSIIDFNLLELIENTADMQMQVAHEKGIEFNVELDAELPMYRRGDPDRLRQILLNVLSNAIKFTKSGGVVFSVCQKGADRTVFSVRDTGIGISPEQLSLIFKPFVQADSTTTRSFGGTGLGLTICKQLVETMGGSINVESQVGEGSTFNIILPLEPAFLRKRKDTLVATDSKPLSISTKPIKKSLSILIVDDAEENLLVLSAYLRDSSHRIVEAENGVNALEIFQKEAVDLVFMDMMMPVMDGYEATRAIRNYEKKLGLQPIPIIALTAQALKEDLDKTLEAGCNSHLTKPVSKTRLIETIDRFNQ